MLSVVDSLYGDYLYHTKFSEFNGDQRDFTALRFPSLDYFYSPSTSLQERNISLLHAIKTDVKSMIFLKVLNSIPTSKKTKILGGELDFSGYQEAFKKKAQEFAHEQYLKNHETLLRLFTEYGKDIFKQVFEPIALEDKKNILSGLVDLTAQESRLRKAADQHLKDHLIHKVQYNNSEIFEPLITEFSEEIIEKVFESFSLEELKEMDANPATLPSKIEEMEDRASKFTFIENKAFLSHLGKVASSSLIKTATMTILTPSQLEKAQLGKFRLIEKESEISTYLDNFMGEFDLRTLKSALKFDSDDVLNKAPVGPSGNFRVFKWSMEGSKPEIELGLSARHGISSRYLGGRTPGEISSNLSTAGFRSMISLSDHDIDQVYALWTAHGADHTRICHPICDYSSTDYATVKTIYEYALNSAERRKNLLINCGEGFGRSGLVAAALLLFSYYEELKSTPILLREVLSKDCTRTKIKDEGGKMIETTTTVKFAINSIRLGDRQRGLSIETDSQIQNLEEIEKEIRRELAASL